MQQYYLYIDESGKFLNEAKQRKKGKNPSLVGGVLVRDKELRDADLKAIYNKGMELIGMPGVKFVKTNELETGEAEFALFVLEKAIAKKYEFVVFENIEYHDIKNSTITYLNIFAEGVVQLLRQLCAEQNDFVLNILIAKRRDTAIMEEAAAMKEMGGTDEQKKMPDSAAKKSGTAEKNEMEDGQIWPPRIQDDKYLERLDEGITREIMRQSLPLSFYKQYTIDFDMATKNEKLKLCDIVCNTWITRSSGKFDDEQRLMIAKLYKDDYHFFILENTIRTMVRNGDLADAVYETCFEDPDEAYNRNLNMIIKGWKKLDENEQKVFYDILNGKITALLAVYRNLEKSKRILLRLQQDFLGKMKNFDVSPGTFALDVCLHLCATYSHEGDVVNTEKQFEIFGETFKDMPKRWETIDYYNNAMIRRAVHKTNCFDFYGAVTETTNIIKVLDDSIKLVSDVEDLRGIFQDIKMDSLGKALGTRLQAYGYMIRKDKTAYKEAVKDSERAISEFSTGAHISRQYQYRSQIECENGNYSQSLKWLLGAENMHCAISSENVAEFLEGIYSRHKQRKDPGFAFYLMHYTRLVAEAGLHSTPEPEASENTITIHRLLAKAGIHSSPEATEISLMMQDMMFFKELPDKQTIAKSIKKLSNRGYPDNIIWWKIATCHALNGRFGNAQKHYKKAIDISVSRPERLTLVAIGLGIMAECAGFLLSAKPGSEVHDYALQTVVKLSEEYSSFMQAELPEKMREYFIGWEKVLGQIASEDDLSAKSIYLLKLSREIPY